MRQALAVVVLTAGVMEAGCAALVTGVMVHAPNKERAAGEEWFSPSKLLEGEADRELFVEAGPPEALIRVRVIEPAAAEVLAGGGPRGTILVLHGYREASFLVRPTADRFAERGYRAVLVDLRGHGGSTGDYITYGAVESRDLVQVADALEGEGLLEGELGVWGVSMGAATAVQYAARDERVAAVVAVTPFTSMRDVVPHVLRRALPVVSWSMSARRMQDVVEAAAGEAGFDPDEADAVAAMEKVTVPVLVIGGRWDAITPFAHSEALHAAAPAGSRLVALQWTGHIGAGLDLDSKVREESTRWFEAKLNGSED